ncbi:PAS domain-containing protein [bacterium]|nr:PAS domain-containing protein [bacterium]
MTRETGKKRTAPEEKSGRLEARICELEKSLADNEAFSRALFHFNPVSTFVVDREGRIIRYNFAKEKSGVRLPAAGDVMYRDYAARHDNDMYAELMDSIVSGKIKHFAGKPYCGRILNITISPFPHGAIITSQDVTEQRQAETALRKSEREKDLILNSVSEVVSYVDRDYRMVWTNPAALELAGLDAQEIAGRTCYSMWQKRESPCPGCVMKILLASGQPGRMEMASPDGRIWNRIGYPVRDDQGEVSGAVIVMLDITKSREAQEERAKLQAQLLQAQKMEAVGTLAGGVAHDFNNLLTAIRGCIEMALLKIPEGDELRKDLLEVQESADRAADLTRQLLMFGRRHHTRFAPANLNQTLDGMLKLLHRLIGEDIEIVTVFEKDPWTVRSDAGLMEQLVLNLVLNARDAMPGGGKIILKTENVTIDESYCVVIPDARSGQFIRLSISDTGKGMDRRTRERIFEPFFSTKGPGKGTGLGLSVVYGIVKQHDGWINVYSEPGRGTEFKIYLPVIREQVPQRAAETVSLEPLAGLGERILIVEDEKSVRDFAMRALLHYGYRVETASSAREALELFVREKGDFHLVFSDVVLPDKTGLDLVDQLLAINGSVKVVVTSGYTDSKSQWSKIREKGYPFIQKPYSVRDMLGILKRCLPQTQGRG